ncbi:hypothetical protein GCM10009754_87660 [Amycolatopsis minnesotensis]|uniref:Uncharacterized protein n=1 Tax=Amycolatopsis minnesotensis TaxID=337894 RepID=A0ABN2SYE6_9PSEU
MADPHTVEAWLCANLDSINPQDPEAFVLRRYTINGDPLPITRTSEPGGQTYTVHPSATTIPTGQLYTVSYEYTTLIATGQHGIHLDIDTITHRLTVDFTATDPTISHIDPMLNFPGYHHTRPHYNTTTPNNPTSLTATMDGWIMPITTIGFIWTHGP